MADFGGKFDELRKIGQNSVCQGKLAVEEYMYVPFKYNQTAVQRKIKVNHFISLCGQTL